MIFPTHRNLRGLVSKHPQRTDVTSENFIDLKDPEWIEIKDQILRFNYPIDTINIRYKPFDVSDVVQFSLEGNKDYLRIIGIMFYFGYGAPEEKVLGREILNKIVDLGCDVAKYDLYVVLYQDGFFEESVKMIDQLAQKQYLPAMVRLGVHYKNGLGVMKDQAKAIEVWKVASELGSISAAIGLEVRNFKQGNFYKKFLSFFY